MRKRNLLYSIIAVVILIGSFIFAINSSDKVNEITVTSQRGVFAITLDTTFKDGYSAKSLPEETLLLYQSKKHNLILTAYGAQIPEDEKNTTVDERLKRMGKELQERGILLSIKKIDNQIHYSMKMPDNRRSTSRLYIHKDNLIAISIINDLKSDETIANRYLDSVQFLY